MWYRYIKVSFFILILVTVAGCGGSSSNSRPRSANRPAPSGGGKASISTGGGVAATTRAVTLKRQGSWNLTSDGVVAVSDLVVDAAREYNMPKDLIFGIIWVESRFNPEAVSPVGARGLMQLMPRTADYLAECIDWSGRNDSFEPDFNVAAGTYYIARLIKQFDGDVDLALAAYNAGPTKVRRWLAGTGLPKVSIEYATMVQTARTFFGGTPGGVTPSGTPLSPNAPKATEPVITDDELDRLGLTILIAGLSNREFGLEREDEANPFGDRFGESL